MQLTVCAVSDTTVGEAHFPVDWACDFMHKLFTSNLGFYAQLYHGKIVHGTFTITY